MMESMRMSPLIAAKISAVKRKHAIVSLISGISLAVAALLGILAVTMIIDWLIELSYLTRAAALIANLSISGYLLVRYAIMPVIFGPDDETVSLWVEAQEPAFASRLISTVQLTRPGAMEEGFSRSMCAALIRQTEILAEPVEFTRVIATDRMGRNAAIAVGVVVLGLIGLAVGGEPAGDLLKRALLVPGVDVPRKTRVIMDEDELLVARGDDLTLTARAEGIIPDEGQIVIEHASGRTQVIPMPAVEGQYGQFARTIQGVQESFTYRVHLNDGRSGSRHVRAEERPAVADLSIEQIFPAYTGLPQIRRAPGDLSILEGSRLVLRVRASKPVARSGRGEPANYVHLHGSDARYRLEHDSSDPTMLIAVDGDQRSIPLPKFPHRTTGFSIHLTDELGLTSKDPTVYRIDLIPDRAPTVRITHPLRREELVTSAATLVVGFDAADDFALGQARIRYRMNLPEDERSDFTGLTAAYFNNDKLEGTAVRGIDGPINFTWGKNDRPAAGLDRERFSARWTGVIVPPVSGQYVFIVECDDGQRLWINDQLLTEQWYWEHRKQIAESQPIELEGGKPYPIKIEYRQNSGEAYLKLRWRHQAAMEEVVPRSALFTSMEAWAEATRKEGQIDLNLAGHPKSFRGYYQWRMQSLDPTPPPGTMIEWWVEITDTNDQTGPGVAESEHYVARLVTPEEKRAELMTRLGEAWNPLGTITERQQQINQNLGQMIIEQGRDRGNGNQP